MNGGDDFDLEPTELNTPVEVLEAVTLGCIETLRRKRVCLFPGPHVPPQPHEIMDFGQCVPYLGDSNALIFCAPHHGKDTALARIQHYAGGGDPAIVFDHDECVTDFDFIGKDELIFPHKADNLLVARLEPNIAPQPARPPDSQFWAHYVVLKIFGRDDKLHLLHLGLRGDHAWLYFLATHGIRVARTITNQ